MTKKIVRDDANTMKPTPWWFTQSIEQRIWGISCYPHSGWRKHIDTLLGQVDEVTSNGMSYECTYDVAEVRWASHSL